MSGIVGCGDRQAGSSNKWNTVQQVPKVNFYGYQ